MLHSILIVDDEIGNLHKLRRTFIDRFEILEAQNGREALEILSRREVMAIITDQKMPGLSGVELLKRALQIAPDTIRIVLTGYTDTEDLIDAINQGHVHRYITKPWEPFSLRQAVEQEIERWELERENRRLSEELRRANEVLERENLQLKHEVQRLRKSEHRLIYGSRPMKELLSMLDRVVDTDSTVLIQGETGTGKELIARYLHLNSSRRQRPFVAVNCGAIPHDLIESAFFGHRKGAFTGATESRKGYFELAHQGTLFLDEIGESPPDLQVKLLRVLQEPEILPVGAQSPIRINVRVIASTNRNLSERVAQGRFRQDFFFRLNVFSILVPPLRARREDVELLAGHFLKECVQRLNKPISGFEPATLQLLQDYDWPGNVRELENEIERMVILGTAGQPLAPGMVSDRIRFHPKSNHNSEAPLKDRLAELERQLILESLEAHNQNKSQAAQALGITRQTIIAKLKQYRVR